MDADIGKAPPGGTEHTGYRKGVAGAQPQAELLIVIAGNHVRTEREEPSYPPNSAT